MNSLLNFYILSSSNLSHVRLTLFQEVAGILTLGMYEKCSANFSSQELSTCSFPFFLFNFGISKAFLKKTSEDSPYK